MTTPASKSSAPASGGLDWMPFDVADDGKDGVQLLAVGRIPAGREVDVSQPEIASHGV